MNSYQSALSYKPRAEDLFVVTYPKCGTTWAQHMIMLIFNHGQPMKSPINFFAATPFLEMTGAKGAEEMVLPGVIKVHLPYHLVPWSEKSKYIYIARNPKDCCVSLYHHQKNLTKPFQGDFDEFFELFIAGYTRFGDYFDHLLGWYAQKNEPNVLFITYEEMKEQTSKVTLKIASFIDDKLYGEPLRNDPNKLQNVIKYCSFDFMKLNVDKMVEDVLALPTQQILDSALPDPMKTMFIKFQALELNGCAEITNSEFMRKGIIGDWKNYFSDKQSKLLDEKFVEKTKGTDIPLLWEKYM